MKFHIDIGGGHTDIEIILSVKKKLTASATN
jgi:hypothetical protein